MLDSKVEWIESEAVVLQPAARRRPAHDLARYREDRLDEIARFSQKDAAEYPKFLDLMTALAGVVGGLMEMTPPDLPDVSFADIRRGASMLGPLRRLGRKRIPELVRVLPMSVADLLDEFFESPAVKGAIGASAILGVSYGPRESGTALAMLSNWAQSGTGLFRSASVVRGGIGALTAAMAAAARDFGAEIRTGAPVGKITVEGRRATGVELDSGEHIAATVVASATDVTSTFLDLVGPRSLDAQFVRHVRSHQVPRLGDAYFTWRSAVSRSSRRSRAPTACRCPGRSRSRRLSTTSRRPTIPSSTAATRRLRISTC